jgi:hypothetical protein
MLLADSNLLLLCLSPDSTRTSEMGSISIEFGERPPASRRRRSPPLVSAIALFLALAALASTAWAESILVDTGEPCEFGQCQSDAIFRAVDRIRFIAQSVTIDQAATLSEIQLFGIYGPSTESQTIEVDVTTKIGPDATEDDVIASFSLDFSEALEWRGAAVDFDAPSGEIFFVLSVDDGHGPTIPALNFVSPVPPLADTRYFRAQQSDPSPGSTLFAPGVDFRISDRSPEYAWEIGVRIFGTPKPNLPVANAGPDRDVECDSQGGAMVRLDGSASYDSGGDSLDYRWSNSFGTALGVQPEVLLAPGEHRVTLEVENDEGAKDRDHVTLRVVDTTPPEILSLTSNPGFLWPPNHRMVRVSISARGADVCSPEIGCLITGVRSSEPEDSIGDGHTSPDWWFVDWFEVMLRSETTGRKTPRIYTVTVTCMDSERNLSIADLLVPVAPEGGR